MCKYFSQLAVGKTLDSVRRQIKENCAEKPEKPATCLHEAAAQVWPIIFNELCQTAVCVCVCVGDECDAHCKYCVYAVWRAGRIRWRSLPAAIGTHTRTHTLVNLTQCSCNSPNRRIKSILSWPTFRSACCCFPPSFVRSLLLPLNP